MAKMPVETGSSGGRKEAAPVINRKEMKQPVNAIMVAAQRRTCK